MEAIHHLKRLDEDELYLAFKSALLDGHSGIYAADTTGLLHLAGASQLIQPVPYQNPPIQYRQSYVEEPNEVTGQQIDILA